MNSRQAVSRGRRSHATVKKFYREKDNRIRLQPANASLDPIYVRDVDLHVQGVVVGVLRKY